MEKAQLNIRTTTDIKAQFDENVKAAGLTQSEYLEQLMEMASIDELKKRVPEEADALNEYEYHLSAVREAYQSAIKKYTEAYEIAASKVRTQLDGLNEVVKSNRDLQSQNQELFKALKTADDKVTRQAEELKALSAARERADELLEQVLSLKEQLVTQKEEHIKEIESVRESGFKQLIEALTAKA